MFEKCIDILLRAGLGRLVELGVWSGELDLLANSLRIPHYTLFNTDYTQQLDPVKNNRTTLKSSPDASIENETLRIFEYLF